MDSHSVSSGEYEGEVVLSHTHEISQEMRQCLQNCLDCHRICTETATHCLKMGGKHAEAHYIGLLLDCAAICATSAGFLLRASHFHSRTCGVCADICGECAVECSKMADADKAMKECADTCRRCAESCKKMAGAAA